MMPPDLAHQFNPSGCQADFTYALTPSTITIQDTGKGKKSVTNDLEAVLRKIEYWHQGSIALSGDFHFTSLDQERNSIPNEFVKLEILT